MARTCLNLLLFGLLASTGVSAAETAADPVAAQSPTALLPVYAVDVPLDASAVDGSAFPSSSPAHPHAGTSEVFQQLWTRLRPSGFNAVRFKVDLSEGQTAVIRVANLCAWATREGISLLPVLVATPSSPLGDGYATAAASFVNNVVAILRGGGPESLGTYPRILMFQLGDDLNHPARNGRLAAPAAAQRVVAAADALRHAEQGALEGSGLYSTPLLAGSSFDAELVSAGAPAGAELGEAAYAQAYAGLRQALAPIAASTAIEAIGITWFPGSVSAGGVERLGPLIQSLAADLAGKQLLVVTGFSTAFGATERQRQLSTLAFTNLAEIRAGAADSPLLGLVFHQALSGGGPENQPPAGFEAARQAWQPEVMAAELMALWRGETASPAIAYWDGEVEARMGLLALETAGQGAVRVAAQPALQGLEEIAGIVSSAPAPAAVSPDATPSNPVTPPDHGAAPGDQPAASERSQVKEKVTGVLKTLLDQLLARLGEEVGDRLDGAGGDSSGTEGPGSGSTAGTSQVAIAGASCAPTNPKVHEKVSCLVTLRNESPDADAEGLSVALLDNEDYLLGDEAVVEEVALAKLAQSTVTVPWRPTATGNQLIRVKLYDAGYSEIATALGGQVTVVPAAKTPPPKGGLGKLGDPSRFTDLLSGKASSPALKPARPGFPMIGVLVATSKAMSAEGNSFGLPIANSSKRSMKGLSATLLVDGKSWGQQRIRTLLPGQSQNVVFNRLRLAAGTPHELRVVLARPGAAPLVAGVLHFETAKATRPLVRQIPGSTAGTPAVSRVRLPLDAVRAAAIPGTVARTVTAPNARVAPGAAGWRERRQSDEKPIVTGEAPPSTKAPASRVTPPRRTLPIAPQPRPDLALERTSVRLSPAAAPTASAVGVQVAVTNAGTGPSGAATISFVVRGARGEVAAGGKQRLGPVAPRATVFANWNFMMPSAGSWRLEVEIQSADDANVSNNAASLPLTVLAAPPKLRANPAGRIPGAV